MSTIQNLVTTMFAFILALLVGEIVILLGRHAIERCKGDTSQLSKQGFFRTNVRKTFAAVAVLIPATLALKFTAWDQIGTTVTEWISMFVAYLTLRALSFILNGQIFRGFTDQLCSTPRYSYYHNAYLVFYLLLNKSNIVHKQ